MPSLSLSLFDFPPIVLNAKRRSEDVDPACEAFGAVVFIPPRTHAGTSRRSGACSFVRCIEKV